MLVVVPIVTAGVGGLGPAKPASAADQTYTIRYVGNQGAQDLLTLQDLKVKELIEQRSQGRIHVDVFYGQQFAGGVTADYTSQAKLGIIQMVDVDPATISAYSADWNVLNLPFLFQDSKQVFKAVDGQPGFALGDELYRTGSFKLLGFGDLGARYILTARKPVRTLADLKGLKMRVIPSPVTLATYRALGANPVGMNSSEVQGALNQGVIDGLDYPVVSLITNGFYAFAKYYSLVAVSYNVSVIMMNRNYWDALPTDLQAIVQQAVRDANAQERAQNTAAQTQAFAAAKAKGLEVIPVPENEIAKFRAAVKPVYDDWTSQHGARLLDQIRASISAP